MDRRGWRQGLGLGVAAVAIFMGLVPVAGLSRDRGPWSYPYADGRPPGFADRDLDGVPDERDNCPTIANEPLAGGQQPQVCGAGLSSARHDHVFLASRTFRPRRGVDPMIEATGRPVHVLLHIGRDDDPVVLSDAERARLDDAGVMLWQYLPYYTYYATVPGTRSGLAALAALPFVHGVSAIQPRDRIARSVRLARGGPSERQADGALYYAVEFFPDAPPRAIAQLLAGLGMRQTLHDEEERFVRVRSFDDLLALAESDLVYWIDDLPGAMRPSDDLALAETSAEAVDRVHGFRGDGLTVAMVEVNKVPPGHPDLDGRVVHDGSGPEAFDNHNLEVAGIMIGDGAVDATKRGFLPDATLVSFAALGPFRTARQIYYRYPRQARDDHDAVLINYSVGWTVNCNKLGEYGSDGKNIDKSVHREGIAVVRAVGNTRGPDGDLAIDPAVKHGPCQANLDSLRQSVPKNDVAVGNWSLAFDGGSASRRLHTTSAAGPASDERLKPDLVAPGQGVSTTTIFGGLEPFYYREFGGTSGAAPVASGVMGQVYEAFGSAQLPRDPQTIPPATVKAILLHTARDVGPPGPDYFHGWGLIDGAAAVRVALNHHKAAADDTLFVYEGELDAGATEDAQQVEITSTTYGLKVTLVWDDPHGASSAQLALINDLDLKVTDPNGVNHYPFDTRLIATDPVQREIEALLGARTCEELFWILCRDARNNVEQVIATDPSGGPLPVGVWTVTVNAFHLPEPAQGFSLVVETGECPLRIFKDATLSADVDCPHDPLAPVAISIEVDDVALDCDDQTVSGAGGGVDGFLGQYAGIRTLRDRVTVRNCIVEGFDVGVDFRDNADGRIEEVRTLNSGTAGIRVTGARHEIWDSVVAGVASPDGYGITATGDAHVIAGNNVGPGVVDAPHIGIHLLGPSAGSGGTMTGNQVGGTDYGIRIDATNEVDNYTVSRNVITGVAADGISVSGQFTNGRIESNRIEEGFGLDHAGIRIEATPERAPVKNTVSGNLIQGAGSGSQTGIRLAGSRWWGAQRELGLSRVSQHEIFNNIVGWSGDVAVGIYEDLGESSEIYQNHVQATNGGIISTDSLADQTAIHLHHNRIVGAGIGISLTSSNDGRVGASGKASANIITEADTGVSVVNMVKGSPEAIKVTGNAISDISVGGEGIAASSVLALDIIGNLISNPATGPTLRNGIAVDGVATLAIIDNEVRHVQEHGVEIGVGIVDLVFSDNVISAMPAPTIGRALDAEAAIDLDRGNLVMRCNELVGGEYDAIFPSDVDVSFNAWSELGLATGEIDDLDGDGFGETGADWMFSSTDYAGPRIANTKQSSVMTSRISDNAPWVQRTVGCPP